MRVLRCIMLAPAWLLACGFSAPEPARTPPPQAPEAPLSTISATFALSSDDILRALNEKTRDEIAQIRNQEMDCAIAKCRLDLQAVRTGPITGSLGNNALSLTLPIAVTAHLSLDKSLFRTSADGSAAGVVHATTSLSLDGDWRLVTHTEGEVTLSRGELRLGPLRMSFADLWNRDSALLSRSLFSRLDREVAGNVKIKPQGQRLWAKAARPIEIGKSPETWLVLAPERVLLAQPVTRGSNLLLGLGVAVRARVTVSGQPPMQRPPPLPPPAPMSGLSDRFSVVAPVLLPYDAAAKLAMQRLAHRTLSISGMAVQVKTLSIVPSGQDVIVNVQFCLEQSWDPFGWFNACDSGYLRGRPLYDARNQIVRITGVHYDIATQNLFLRVLRALAGDGLARNLEPMLVFHVGADLARLEASVREALSRPQGRGVRFAGSIDSFAPPQLAWTREGFLATFRAQGRVAADLNLRTSLP